jgi:hypothetical protein
MILKTISRSVGLFFSQILRARKRILKTTYEVLNKKAQQLNKQEKNEQRFHSLVEQIRQCPTIGQDRELLSDTIMTLIVAAVSNPTGALCTCLFELGRLVMFSSVFCSIYSSLFFMSVA